MRVLQLAESPYMGGINAHIRSIARAFQDGTNAEIAVATLPGKRPDRWLFDALGAEDVTELPMASRLDFRAAGALREFVAQRKFDLVHTHNYRATLLAIAAKLPVPVVNTCHGMVADPSLKLRVYQAVELRAMRRLPITIAVSDYVRLWLAARGLPAERVRTVNNGYDPDTGAGPLDRSAVGIPDDAVIHLFVGRLSPNKGALEFIRAIGNVPGTAAIIVGDGPHRAECERIAKAGNTPVHFAGMQTDPAPYYRLADVVVLPSRMEALPMTLIEAAACGKPAVATRVGGIPEVVMEGKTGLLVDVDSSDQLQQALARMQDEILRAELGRAAQDRWRTRFSLATMRENLLTTYTDCLSQT